MKKAFLMLLTLSALLFSLCSCVPSSETDGQATKPANEETTCITTETSTQKTDDTQTTETGEKSTSDGWTGYY